MNKLLVLVLAMSLVTICSCGQKDGDSAAPDGAIAGAGENAAEPSYTPLAGGTYSVAGFGDVPIISVAQLDETPGMFAGAVAIEGKVAERFEDRFAFMLVDCGRMEGCGSDCCSQATVPVRLARGDYHGELPALSDNVIVVGTLAITETGYQLDVSGVQHGNDKVLWKIDI